MIGLRARIGSAAVFALACHGALAQETMNPAAPKAEAEKAWVFDASALAYFVPDSSNFLSPVVTADRGRLHLEARYNYESVGSASIWAGYNASVGDTVTLDFTTMIGAVMGDTAGIAPGYELTLTWWKLELTSESEYVFNTRDSAESFFYDWSELSISPVEWFRAGLVVQRTRLYGADRDLQRGVLVGFAWKQIRATAYVFNLDLSKPTYVLAVGVGF